MQLYIKYVTDWKIIRIVKQKNVEKNERGDSLRVDHGYQTGDKVLVTDNNIHRKLNCPTRGPGII